MAQSREEIKEFSGKILGYVVTESNGDAYIQKFAGPILGTYKKSSNQVTKFAGPVIGTGKGFLYTLLK